jgi:hypothetical protein
MIGIISRMWAGIYTRSSITYTHRGLVTSTHWLCCRHCLWVRLCILHHCRNQALSQAFSHTVRI